MHYHIKLHLHKCRDSFEAYHKGKMLAVAHILEISAPSPK